MEFRITFLCELFRMHKIMCNIPFDKISSAIFPLAIILQSCMQCNSLTQIPKNEGRTNLHLKWMLWNHYLYSSLIQLLEFFNEQVLSRTGCKKINKMLCPVRILKINFFFIAILMNSQAFIEHNTSHWVTFLISEFLFVNMP